jgi:protein-tyrosine phosphatase
MLFKKKSKVEVDLSPLVADMHSHLLPGIDDGAPDSAASIELIKGMEALGYKKLVTTPHILWDMYKNDESTIGQAKKTLGNAMPMAHIKVAAEYYLDDHFDKLLESNTPLFTIKGNLVLVEFSFVEAPINHKEKLFNMEVRGYSPVLAHPERYLYFGSNKKMYDELKEAGYLFQLNILSLVGHYGKASYDLAHYLIKKKYVDFLGSDVHNLRHIEAIQMTPSIMAPINSLLDSGNILNPTL